MDKRGNTSRQEQLFTWDEVKLQNNQKNIRIIINDQVYDVTQWSSRHPGGSEVLSYFAGQDASEAFSVFHPNMESAKKYLKTNQVGKVVSRENDPQEEEMKTDFEELRETAEKMGLFRPNIPLFLMSVLQILVLEGLALWLLYFYGSGWIPFLLAACLLATSQTQAGWLQHDLGHSSAFTSARANHVFHLFIMNFVKGASADWWNLEHNKHHAKTNILGKDPSVELDVLFVIGDEMSKKAAKNKNHIMAYNWQHHYFFLTLPPLFIPVYVLLTNVSHPIVKRKFTDFVILMLGYSRYLFLYYPLFGSVRSFLGFYFFFRVIESNWLTWVSLANHLPMQVETDSGKRWLPLQVQATCNFESSAFNDWFTGHLTKHIEHHLLPMVPRHNLHKLTPMVKSLCKKHGLRYEVKPLWTAFRDVVKSLKHSGELWEEYYNAFHHA